MAEQRFLPPIEIKPEPKIGVSHSLHYLPGRSGGSELSNFHYKPNGLNPGKIFNMPEQYLALSYPKYL